MFRRIFGGMMSSVQVNFFSSERAKSVRHQKADTYSHPELIAASAGEVETASGGLGEELELRAETL